jgi:hypothetical protein
MRTVEAHRDCAAYFETLDVQYGSKCSFTLFQLSPKWRKRRESRVSGKEAAIAARLPLNCRLGPRFVKVVAQSAFTRRLRWLIVSRQPVPDESVALKHRHTGRRKLASIRVCQRIDRPLNVPLNMLCTVVSHRLVCGLLFRVPKKMDANI